MLFDLLAVNLFCSHFLKIEGWTALFNGHDLKLSYQVLFHLYVTILWFLSTIYLRFYEVYRFTTWSKLIILLIRQFLFFAFVVYAFIGFFRGAPIDPNAVINYLFFTLLSVTVLKLFSFFGLRIMRQYFKGNLRNVVVIGHGESAHSLKKLFTTQKELGYNLKAVFNSSNNSNGEGSIEDSFEYLKNRSGIDEIYCAIDELSEKDLNTYISISQSNNCNIKFISNTRNLASARLKTEYYQYTPVLSLEEVRLNNRFNQLIKRSFDVCFSVVMIVFVLSWLSIILFVLIKLESRGPVFYRHKRTGINYKIFTCYKYRSMRITEEVQGTYVRLNDKRVTKVGKFLRKTNLDEMPQFFNVLKGDMSVVGPRPHMLSYTEAYSKKIDKYNFIFRHHVKPGITGLAQTRGYRGEIKSDQDIIGRVKYDIFYIENWSFLLDLKIIVNTFYNMIKGEDKAY